jgi:hypothetical protein
MKILMIVAIVGMLALAGLAVASALDAEEVIEEKVSSCGGGCGISEGCSASCGGRCGLADKKSCGCGLG